MYDVSVGFVDVAVMHIERGVPSWTSDPSCPESNPTGNTTIDGTNALTTISGDYSFTLPKLNIVATPHDDVVLRLGYGQDISPN